MPAESAAREAICRLGASMFSRGFTFGTSGNISVRLDDGWLLTPTNVAMGDLDPARLRALASQGRPVLLDVRVDPDDALSVESRIASVKSFTNGGAP